MLTAARLSGARLLLATNTPRSTRQLVCKAARAISGNTFRKDVRGLSNTGARHDPTNTLAKRKEDEDQEEGDAVPADEYTSLGARELHEHAVISAFDLFSIGGMLDPTCICGNILSNYIQLGQVRRTQWAPCAQGRYSSTICWTLVSWRRYVTVIGVLCARLHELVQVHTVKITLYVPAESIPVANVITWSLQ